MTFKKKTLTDTNGVIVGEGNNRIISISDYITFNVILGSLIVEGHSGSTGAGIQTTYKNGQGAISIAKAPVPVGGIANGTVNLYLWKGSLILGANTVMANSGSAGTNNVASRNDIYSRVSYLPTAVTIDPTATESALLGDRTFLRTYHPSSSTDTNVLEGETVLSATNNKLWTKRGGTIRDAMGTIFA